SAQPISRIVITPAKPTVVAGDTLRLRAQALDANGQPVPNARILFQPMGMVFEARVDTAGLITSGATGVVPVAVIGIVAGSKPFIQRVEVSMVPGPAARITVAPTPTTLLTGQRTRLEASVFSQAGD